jgi:hypothetical protein
LLCALSLTDSRQVYFFICSIPFGKRMVDGCIKSVLGEKCQQCQKSLGLSSAPKEESVSQKILKSTGLTSTSTKPPPKKGIFGV